MSNYIGKKRIIFSTIVFLTTILAIIVFVFYYTQLKKRFIDPTGDIFKKILFRQENFNVKFDEKILSNSVFLKLDDHYIHFIEKRVGNIKAFERPEDILENKLEKDNLQIIP